MNGSSPVVLSSGNERSRDKEYVAERNVLNFPESSEILLRNCGSLCLEVIYQGQSPFVSRGVRVEGIIILIC